MPPALLREKRCPTQMPVIMILIYGFQADEASTFTRGTSSMDYRRAPTSFTSGKDVSCVIKSLKKNHISCDLGPIARQMEIFA